MSASIGLPVNPMQGRMGTVKTRTRPDQGVWKTKRWNSLRKEGYRLTSALVLLHHILPTLGSSELTETRG